MRTTMTILLVGVVWLTSLSGGVLARPAVAAQTPRLTLHVLVRTPDGAGVPDLTITLQPQPADLGGPRRETVRSVSGTTDPTGQATFVDLAPGMWRVQLAGSVAGVPLQPVAEQARPPYGRAATGDGFPIPVALGSEQEEGGAAVGAPGDTAVQQALFVGQARAGVWVPEVDLGRPEAPPQPITTLPTPPPIAGVPTLDVQATAVVPLTQPPLAGLTGSGEVAGGSAPRGSALTQATPLVVWSPLALCYVVPILIGLMVLGQLAWHRLRHSPRLPARVVRASPPPRGETPPPDTERG